MKQIVDTSQIYFNRHGQQLEVEVGYEKYDREYITISLPTSILEPLFHVQFEATLGIVY